MTHAGTGRLVVAVVLAFCLSFGLAALNAATRRFDYGMNLYFSSNLVKCDGYATVADPDDPMENTASVSVRLWGPSGYIGGCNDATYGEKPLASCSMVADGSASGAYTCQVDYSIGSSFEERDEQTIYR